MHGLIPFLLSSKWNIVNANMSDIDIYVHKLSNISCPSAEFIAVE